MSCKNDNLHGSGGKVSYKCYKLFSPAIQSPAEVARHFPQLFSLLQKLQSTFPGLSGVCNICKPYSSAGALSGKSCER